MQQQIDLEWASLVISDIALRQSRELLLKARQGKDIVKAERVCSNCGKYFLMKDMIIKEYLRPESGKISILYSCKACNKRSRRGTRGNY